MTDNIRDIIDGCMDRNATIRRYMTDYADRSLSDFIELQRNRLSSNNRIAPMQDKEDYISICTDHVRNILGEDYALKVRRSLETGALQTADHLGGFYTPQSFQGDLLFSKLGDYECIPCFAAGSVTLHSGTYGRGIQYFSEQTSIGKIPLFPGKYSKYSASLVSGIEEKAINRALQKAQAIGHKSISHRITDVLTNCYLDQTVLEHKRFADQCMLIGAGLYRYLGEHFSHIPLIHIETEEVSGRLFIKDTSDKSSLVYRMLFDKTVMPLMTGQWNGRCPGDLLFRGNDGCGHMFPLKLCDDGNLRGTTIHNEELCFPVDPDILSDAVEKKQIFVSAYLRALMLAFARGFTWFGGIFQSLYLPEWQKATALLLREAGLLQMAEMTEEYDTSGYISGPLFAMFDNGAGAAPAGPLELSLAGADSEMLDRWLENTTVYDAHVMGMFEFYYDLFPTEERIDGWYGALASFEKTNYTDNIIFSDPS